jgi:bacillolysin
MKLKNFTPLGAIVALVLFSMSAVAQVVVSGQMAEERIPGAELIRDGRNTSIPSYVRFKAGHEIQVDKIMNWTQAQFKLDESTTFDLLRKDDDNLGHVHYRYQQNFNGMPIKGADFIVHTKNNMVYSVNGHVIDHMQQGPLNRMSEENALNKVLAHVDAEAYRWESPAEEKQLQYETKDSKATYYPEGELIFMTGGSEFGAKNYRLCWKFNIYASAPLFRGDVFIDAATGEIVFVEEHIHHADANGTAQTAYSGSQAIVTDTFGGGFRLREAGRGNGIETWDMNEGTNYGNAVDFVDTDNNWNNVNAEQDEVATDAHWGAEMTYDYFLQEHSRNSIDDAGFALYSYVHYDAAYANAFWDGQRMTYGDGNGAWSPLTALDIAGHEIGHGLTTFSANLVYQDESGALNESFSDIFGTAIEWFAKPATANWALGEDIGSPLRNLQNPNTYGDPDTYFGTNWAPLGGPDNGGVHTNSGVQNKWYYILSEGETGTNDNGDSYAVSGVGMINASAIAFRNLTVYLTTNSTFADARFYGIQSAQDLFGGCSPEVEATTNAWYAVGVGPIYSPLVLSDFNASTTGGCVTPFDVNFTNLSTNGQTYEWDFGDSNTSTATNPMHTYTTPGVYTVTLITDGGLCGADTVVETNHIYVGQLAPPTPSNGSRCDPGTVSLAASGAGTLSWYDAPTGGNLVNTGNTYTTPSLSATTSYWVESNTGLTPEYVGPPDNTFGGGGYFTGNQALVFDVYRPVELVSVWVDANGAGNRTIELYDNTNTLINSTVVNLANGAQRVNLNWNLAAGTDYEITSPSPDLFRNSDGAAYPYTVQGLVSITSSTATQAGYYYFFYDWELQETPCSSGRTEVIAGISAAPTTVDGSNCGTGSVALSATGTGVGTLDWYDAPTGGTLVNTGNTFNTPSISSTTTYYVEETIPGVSNYVGPTDNSFGGGGYFTGDQHLIFDVATVCTLNSVWVDANGGGNRTIELRDDQGGVLQSTTVNLQAGQQRVTLNFPLTPGTDYQLGTTANPDLYRNNSGPSYPYDLPGYVTITNSSAGTDFYYFFYDWEIQEPACVTTRIPVTATIDPAANATITAAGPFCLGDPSLNLTAVDNGGQWTGTGITDSNAGTFDPATAGIGNHTITYTITGNCGDQQTIQIAVNTAFDATITSTGPFCSNDAASNLTAVDNGGQWTGTGITDANAGTFDPATAGVGTHSITYTITGNCGDMQTASITVTQSANATITPAGPFCESDAALNMSAVDNGGQWVGTGITDANAGTFDPATAGPGTHTITYTITGTCGDMQQVDVIVIADADATITPPGPICDYDPSLNLTGATGGGQWSGTGITDANAGTFDPATAGPGTHTITYTISSQCGDQQTINITVDNCSSIGENGSTTTVSVYPNPNTGLFTLVLEDATGLDKTNIEVTNAIGQIVLKEQIIQTATKHVQNIDLQNVESGMYFMRVYRDNINVVQKLIIK